MSSVTGLRAFLCLICVCSFGFGLACIAAAQTNTAKQPLNETVKQQMGRRLVVPDTAIDSTGLGATCASAYFVKHRSRKETPWKTMVYHRYPNSVSSAMLPTSCLLVPFCGSQFRMISDSFWGNLEAARTRPPHPEIKTRPSWRASPRELE